MPNWCRNSAIFSHSDTNNVAELAKLIRAKGEVFQHLRPMPESESDNWYDWCNKNWGTKLDAHECELWNSQENWLSCTFETAWTPPIALFDYLKTQGWSIECEYMEDGVGFIGKYNDGVNECFNMHELDLITCDELREWARSCFEPIGE